MKTEKYDVAIIGAGPAGMMAAVRAAECGARVVLLEKNHIPGMKLLMTGKQRCNVTNAETDVRKFAEHFGKKGRFLFGALYHFGVRETMDFFLRNGLRTKIEPDGRVFPESDRATDVREVFLRRMKEDNIMLFTDCRIKKILQRRDAIEKIILAAAEISANNYVISTGGLSYPRTGSTGDGYGWAEQMGHTIIRPTPALTPVVVREKWVRELEGLSLRNVRVSIYQNNKKQDDRIGEALFTGNGLSGPVILDMSSSIGRLLVHGQADLFIDFQPDLDSHALDKRILQDLQKQNNKSIKNILSGMLPKKLIPVILRMTNVDPEKKGNSITKEERKQLRLISKQFPLIVKCLSGFDRAIITSGGISLKEIDPGTMRSRIIKNLYFAGEILDLDGPTGGYNLQVCWSTGYLAGENAARH